MAIRLRYLLLILSFLTFSCEKPDSPAPLEAGDIALHQIEALTGEPTPVKNYIILGLTKRATLPQYAIEAANGTALMGAFFDAAGNPVSVGIIQAGDIAISPAANNLYSYTSNLTDNSSSRAASNSRVMDLAGQDITVSAEGGNGYSGFSQTVHVPADFNLNASDYSKFVNGRSLTLNWTPDPGNAFGNVLINVTPYPGSGAGVSSLSYMVPDNGSFTVPANSMSRFPVNSYFTYGIAKVNEYEVDPVSDIMVYTVVQTASDALLVVPSPGIYARLETDDVRTSGSRNVKLIEHNYTVRFYQNAECTIPLQIWSDITVYVHVIHTEDGTTRAWDDRIKVAKGSSAFNIGWRDTFYRDLIQEVSWTYDYSLTETLNYNAVN